jgi:hypothetical protein
MRQVKPTVLPVESPKKPSTGLQKCIILDTVVKKVQKILYNRQIYDIIDLSTGKTGLLHYDYHDRSI